MTALTRRLRRTESSDARVLILAALVTAIALGACGTTSPPATGSATSSGTSAPSEAPGSPVTSVPASSSPSELGPTSNPGNSPSAVAGSPSLSASPSPSLATASPPVDDWVAYRSKYAHMTFRYPATADWTFLKARAAGEVDWLLGPTSLSVQFMRLPADGLTLDGFVHRIRTDPHYVGEFHVDAVRKITMGGVSGRQMLIHTTFAQESGIDTAASRAKKRYWIITFGLKGSYFYEVSLAGDKGHEADDQALADRFAASVVLN